LKKEDKEKVRIKIQKRRGGVFKSNGMSLKKLQQKKISVQDNERKHKAMSKK
jgi:hypothetical protein